MKDDTILIMGAVGIGAYALYKSGFLQNLGSGVTDLTTSVKSLSSDVGSIPQTISDTINKTTNLATKTGGDVVDTTNKAANDVIDVVNTGAQDVLSNANNLLSDVTKVISSGTGFMFGAGSAQPSGYGSGGSAAVIAGSSGTSSSTPISQIITTGSTKGSYGSTVFDPVGSLLSGSYGVF